MPPKTKIVKDLGESQRLLQLLTDTAPTDDDSGDDVIEQTKRRGPKPLPKSEPAYKPRAAPVADADPVKKPRSEAQVAAWNRALAAREEKRKERMGKTAVVMDEVAELKRERGLMRAEKEAQLKRDIENQQKKFEDKIVKKAVSIKKRQIRKEAVLDEISDDDEPIESIKKKMQKPKSVSPPTPIIKKAPSFIFV